MWYIRNKQIYKCCIVQQYSCIYYTYCYYTTYTHMCQTYTHMCQTYIHMCQTYIHMGQTYTHMCQTYKAGFLKWNDTIFAQFDFIHYWSINHRTVLIWTLVNFCVILFSEHCSISLVCATVVIIFYVDYCNYTLFLCSINFKLQCFNVDAMLSVSMLSDICTAEPI